MHDIAAQSPTHRQLHRHPDGKQRRLSRLQLAADQAGAPLHQRHLPHQLVHVVAAASTTPRRPGSAERRRRGGQHCQPGWRSRPFRLQPAAEQHHFRDRRSALRPRQDVGTNAPGWEQQILGGWQLTGHQRGDERRAHRHHLHAPARNQVVSTTSSVYSLRPNLTGPHGAVYGQHADQDQQLAERTSLIRPRRLRPCRARSSSATPAAMTCADLPSASSTWRRTSALHLPKERYSAEFRIEAFNVLNATNYISPTSNIGTVNSNTGVFTPNASFGQFSRQHQRVSVTPGAGRPSARLLAGC